VVFTIAVINQKGGVGKTTTVANLGAAIARRGCDACLIDLDPQSHLTLHFDIEPSSNQTNIYDVLTGGADFADACQRVGEHLHVVPSVIDLAAAEVELAATVGREQILSDAIAARSLDHRLVMIDCPPSLGLLTLNALAAADEVFIPLQPHFLALQGLGKLLETVRLVQRRINPRLRVGAVILCLYETGTRLAAEVVADLQAFFGQTQNSESPWGQTRIFRTVIRRNVKLAECPSHGQTIFEYDPSSHGAADYALLADEFVAFYPELFDSPDQATDSQPLAASHIDPSTAAPTDPEPAGSPEPQPPAVPPIRLPASEPASEPVETPEPAPAADRPVVPVRHYPLAEPLPQAALAPPVASQAQPIATAPVEPTSPEPTGEQPAEAAAAPPAQPDGPESASPETPSAPPSPESSTSEDASLEAVGAPEQLQPSYEPVGEHPPQPTDAADAQCTPEPQPADPVPPAANATPGERTTS